MCWADLAGLTPTERYQAARGLPKVVHRGDAQAVAKLAACLEHCEPQVRWAAVEALPQIVAKGDAQALRAASARLQDKEWYVRKAAALALPLIVDKGDLHAITAINDLLEDRERHVRKAAVEALSQIARPSPRSTPTSERQQKKLAHRSISSASHASTRLHRHPIDPCHE